jgi:hypothetical protein
MQDHQTRISQAQAVLSLLQMALTNPDESPNEDAVLNAVCLVSSLLDCEVTA